MNWSGFGPRAAWVLLFASLLLATGLATAQELPERARALDTNGNGVIDRDEARGPLQSNFAVIDRDDSGGIDGAELAAFFGGGASGGPGSGPSVLADTVVAEDLSQTTAVIGQLVARQSGPVAARVAGPVAAVRVSVGDRVSKGDPLVILSTDRLRSETDRYLAIVEQRQSQVSIAEAELEKMMQERERIESLRGSSAYSQKRLDDVLKDVAMKRGNLGTRQAELAQALEQLNRSNIDLEDATIRAPYDGVVTGKSTEVGAYLGVGTPVATLINDAALEIEIQVPANRLGGLEPGVELSVNLDDGSQHRATVRALVPVENPLTRTRAVRLTPSFESLVRAPALNQSVTVLVPISSRGTATTVHKDAILRDDGRPFVYLIEQNRVQRRNVTLGESVGQRFVVAGGLREGDRVVVRGNEQLRDGQPVRVVESEGAARAARAGQ